MSIAIMYVRRIIRKYVLPSVHVQPLDCACAKSGYVNARFIIFHEGNKTVFPILASSRQQRLWDRSDSAPDPAAPGVCVALLSTKSVTWLLYSLLVAVQSATSLTLAP